MKIIAHEAGEYDQNSKILIEFSGEEMRTIGVYLARGGYGRTNPNAHESIIKTMEAVFTNNEAARKIAMNDSAIAPIAQAFLERFLGMVRNHAQLLNHQAVVDEVAA